MWGYWMWNNGKRHEYIRAVVQEGAPPSIFIVAVFAQRLARPLLGLAALRELEGVDAGLVRRWWE